MIESPGTKRVTYVHEAPPHLVRPHASARAVAGRRRDRACGRWPRDVEAAPREGAAKARGSRRREG